MAKVLDVSRRSYYDWVKHGRFQVDKHEQLLTTIKETDEVHKGCFGSPRIYKEVKRRGYSVGKRKVEDLIRINGIQAKTKKKLKTNTVYNHKPTQMPKFCFSELIFMNRRGNCWDNSPAESFFATIKKELKFMFKKLKSRTETESEIFKYIEGYYNY